MTQDMAPDEIGPDENAPRSPRSLAKVEHILLLFAAFFLAPIGMIACFWVVFGYCASASGKRMWRFEKSERMIYLFVGLISLLLNLVLIMAGKWMPHTFEWRPYNWG
jgi:hypothetical protein